MIEKALSVIRIGDEVLIFEDRYRANELLNSKSIAKLSVEEADALVAELSKAIHQQEAV